MFNSTVGVCICVDCNSFVSSNVTVLLQASYYIGNLIVLQLCLRNKYTFLWKKCSFHELCYCIAYNNMQSRLVFYQLKISKQNIVENDSRLFLDILKQLIHNF